MRSVSFRHWTDGGRGGEARAWGISGLGCSVGPPTAVERVVGSGWLRSNPLGWALREEGGKVIRLDLSSSEG